MQNKTRTLLNKKKYTTNEQKLWLERLEKKKKEVHRLSCHIQSSSCNKVRGMENVECLIDFYLNSTLQNYKNLVLFATRLAVG